MSTRRSADGIAASPVRGRGRWLASLVAIGAVALGTGPTVSSAAVASRTATGSVAVLYAGSLLDVMTQQIAPAFHRATGYTLSGFANGSDALASEIRGGTEVADVFISASPSVNAQLEGRANGNWVSSYQTLGRSALVLGYNRASRFASALEREPWYDVVARPGFLLGRTDPAQDPKGVLAVAALRDAARRFHEPRLAALADSSANVFTETSLVGELQAGQLDAGFFYAVEAAAAHLSTVGLVGTALAATFTIARVNRDPDPAGARAFVSFLMGPAGRRILARNGIVPANSPRPSIRPDRSAPRSPSP